MVLTVSRSVKSSASVQSFVYENEGINHERVSTFSKLALCFDVFFGHMELIEFIWN